MNFVHKFRNDFWHANIMSENNYLKMFPSFYRSCLSTLLLLLVLCMHYHYLVAIDTKFHLILLGLYIIIYVH